MPSAEYHVGDVVGIVQTRRSVASGKHGDKQIVDTLLPRAVEVRPVWTESSDEIRNSAEGGDSGVDDVRNAGPIHSYKIPKLHHVFGETRSDAVLGEQGVQLLPDSPIERAYPDGGSGISSAQICGPVAKSTRVENAAFAVGEAHPSLVTEKFPRGHPCREICIVGTKMEPQREPLRCLVFEKAEWEQLERPVEPEQDSIRLVLSSSGGATQVMHENTVLRPRRCPCAMPRCCGRSSAPAPGQSPASARALRSDPRGAWGTA